MLGFLYRVMLLVFPSRFRREYGAEMAEVFAACVVRERARGSWLGGQLRCAGGLADTLWLAVSLRVAGRQAAPAQSRHWSPLMRSIDVSTAFRRMRAHPVLSAAIIAMLALGIGATTAIVSVVYGVLLKPLPFPESERLVEVRGAIPARGITSNSLTEASVWDLRDRNRSFEEFGGWHGASFSLTGFDPPERLTGATVSVGFLRALGVQPAAGRLFEPGEDQPGSPDHAVISHGLWTRRFAADRSVVGRPILLGGQPHVVIGVLPPGTPWIDTDVFVPFRQRPEPNRGSWEFSAVGRLKPGISLEAARADLQRVARDLEIAFPKTSAGNTFVANPSSMWIASETLRRTLWILLGAVGLLLVIACVNVTNLLLAQASNRTRESAVRAALGARRFDIVREALTESLLLSFLGAGVGVLVALGTLQIFRSFDPGGIPRLADVELNAWALGASLLAALVVGLVTGVVPTWQTPLVNVLPGLGQGQRTVGQRRQARVRAVLVAAEVALSLALLVGAGLLARSLAQVLTVDRGFQTDQRLLATVSLPGAYAEDRRTQIATSILDRVKAIPEVASVAVVSGRPLSGGSTGLGIVAADQPALPESSVPWATWRIITPDYFRTMGLPLLAGRGFTDQDVISKPWRVVVSKRLAELLWPGQNPLGRTALLWKGQGDTPAEVIGVVGNMRERGLERDPTLAVYFPAGGALGGTTLQLVMHTRGEPMSVVPALRAIVTDVDRNLPISGIRTLEEVVTAAVATRRFTMLLIVVFAGLAVVLALAGVYGVLAYAVARQAPEIGVRLALGAKPGQVLRRVFARGMRPVVVGALLGLAASIWASQLMTTLLFGITPTDAGTYAAACGALLCAAALACYLPARRVLRVDPMIALRTE